MTLDDVPLDDLRFQPLVNESRARVHALCEEWTEANVSDPGITLIEVFAWMTDQLSFRINRLPEKLQVALLALLDTHLYPPRAATTELRFLLAEVPKKPVLISARHTEVSTPRAPGQDPVVFQTIEDFTIEPFQLDRYLLKQEDQDPVEVQVIKGKAAPGGDQKRLFSTPPRSDDALLLGFDASLDRLVVRVSVECDPARWVGVDPEKPPLVWEASAASSQPGDPEDAWVEVETLSDTTAGFNEGSGKIELQLPARVVEHSISGLRRRWLRCRVDSKALLGNPEETSPPRISSLQVSPVGAQLPAEHSRRVERELLGRSDGTPGQVFRPQRSPILALEGDDEGLEVSEHPKDPDSWVRWKEVDSFAESGPRDRHFKLDATAGEIEFGPVVRGADGSFRPYGDTPVKGTALRFTYRHGGGTLGNVVAESLTHLRHPVPGGGMRSVSNPVAASGGSDRETLAAARARKAIELRTRDRAITARDFEQLCHAGAPERVARARCLPGPGSHGERVRVLIVPRVDDPQPPGPLELRKLTPLDDRLEAALIDHLDQRRLVGVTVEICPPTYVGVTAVVKVISERFTPVAALEQRIKDALYLYLNPLVGGTSGSGWEFDRSLGRGELYPLVQAVDGVQEISLLRVYRTDLETGLEDPHPLEGDLSLAPSELIASGAHRVKVEHPRPR